LGVRDTTKEGFTLDINNAFLIRESKLNGKISSREEETDRGKDVDEYEKDLFEYFFSHSVNWSVREKNRAGKVPPLWGL
jgi:hypothetical protein